MVEDDDLRHALQMHDAVKMHAGRVSLHLAFLILGTVLRDEICGEPIALYLIVSTSIGLFFKAIKIDLANLSLSNVDFLPFFFTTMISLNWTLSNVVNLAPQTQSLLLRIAVPSSVGRESTTEVSPFLHMEQIIY